MFSYEDISPVFKSIIKLDKVICVMNALLVDLSSQDKQFDAL